jgi:predicted RNA-binding Zn ribbon-like protein
MDETDLWIAAPAEELCLDFANSRYWRGSTAPVDELDGVATLLRWCEAKAGLPPARAAALKRRAEAEGAAVSLYAEALGLRETIYRLFHRAAEHGAPASADLERLNRALAAAAARRALAPAGEGFGWRIEDSAPSAAGLLTPVLWSAGDLLASRRLARVRYCANPQCRWLFLDDSKSGNRRWCSMSACGNRAKAHRHYARKKGAEA